MRSLFVATLLFFVALPLASVSAQHRSVASACSCGCGAPIPAPMPVAAPCNTCNTCSSCETTNACGMGAYGAGACGGYGTCGGGLCANPALFYQTLYAEFYARNPWYLEHKARESAARRARLYGSDPEAAGKPPVQPAPNKIAEPVKAP